MMTQGVMEAHCGFTPTAFCGGVGRQTPTDDGDEVKPSTPTNGGGGGVNPSAERMLKTVVATVSPQSIPFWIDLALSKPVNAASEALRVVVKDPACNG